MNQKELANQIFNVRYPRSENEHLEEYFAVYGYNSDAMKFLFEELSCLVKQDVSWTGYKLTSKLKENAIFFKELVAKRVTDFSKHTEYSKQEVRVFFLSNHEIIKYAIGRWLIVNAGIAIELFYLSEEKVEPNFLHQLIAKGLKIGDEVIHLHVISNNERQRLKQYRFDVPYDHWDESYYLEAVMTVNRLLQSNPESLGLFCEDSWVFDPKVHEVASDGRPYASFNFLANDLLVGERYFVGEAKPDNQYYRQYEFSLRSPRRLDLHKKGEFMPKTYGIYYPKEKLHKNLETLLAK
ncbi:MAG: hypothetical protein ACOCXP_00605 [Candidatus Dojkabacteria bacterium]